MLDIMIAQQKNPAEKWKLQDLLSKIERLKKGEWEMMVLPRTSPGWIVKKFTTWLDNVCALINNSQENKLLV